MSTGLVQLLGTLISALFGLGGLAAFTAAARDRRRDRALLPLEVDDRKLNLLQEQVVLLGKVNNGLAARITQLETDLDRERQRSRDKQARIESHEQSLADLRRQVRDLQTDPPPMSGPRRVEQG